MNYSNVDHRYREDLAEDDKERCYLPGTNIEVINKNVNLDRVSHIIFDFDGTISTFRQGWEGIMKPLMIEMICGNKDVSGEKISEIEETVANYIDETTGIQTILQMEGLKEMVKDFGLVPEEKIKSAREYKKIYNKRLMKPVKKRIRRLTRGELTVQDLTIKGSVDLLKRIYEEGVNLYLASGTDREDVINEAHQLRVSSYFEGNIYGAVGTLEDYSKEQVVRDIVEEHDLSGPELACIGDGPVELEKAKKQGGITICVASDDKRRWGLNERKRERGISHGADFVVPDFSQWRAIFNLLVHKNRIQEVSCG